MYVAGMPTERSGRRIRRIGSFRGLEQFFETLGRYITNITISPIVSDRMSIHTWLEPLELCRFPKVNLVLLTSSRPLIKNFFLSFL